MTRTPHLVVVEAYDGRLEFLSGNAEERLATRGLGLPLEEIAAQLQCRITVLTWDEWLRYELTPGTFLDWMPFPAARGLTPPGPAPAAEYSGGRVQAQPIPVRDPGHGELLSSRGPSPLTYGLLAESDPLFLLSYCLRDRLETLFAEDPFQAVIVPMWGGSGYAAQMAAATGASPLAYVPFITVVTDTSARRHAANGEGLWTRPAITRRQMEDVSLALADLVLAFGPRGEALARDGRLPGWDAAVLAPRHLSDAVLTGLTAAAERRTASDGIEIFLDEPQDPASGVLAALDAAVELKRRGVGLDRPIGSAGPDAMFAPMKPREFTRYWTSRGFVRELIAEGRWRWTARHESAADRLPVRLYPSAFEHLPSVWIALAQGALPLLSPAAAEGLAPGAQLPRELLLAAEPDAVGLADAIQHLHRIPTARLEDLRRETCATAATAHCGPGRASALTATVEAVSRLLRLRPPAPPLGQVARMFLDRTRFLRALAQEAKTPAAVETDGADTLSVVVVCHNMGPLIEETVESVWASERRPDEILLVDDGSDDPDTQTRLAALEQAGRDRRLPLRVLRQGNTGLAAARNAGLAAATGRFISFLDGDDLIEPAFYGLALEVMRRHPSLGGVAAWALCFGDGVPDGFWNAPQAELPLLLVENTVIVPCLMRAAVVRDLGGYDTAQRYNYEDWELAVRLVAGGRPIVTIPKYLQRYRTRANSMFRTMSDVQNQGMRERMLSRHRDTAAKFSVELAMQLEHRLMRRVYAAPPAATATNGWGRFASFVWRLLSRSA